MYYLCAGKTVRVLNAKYAFVVAIVASLCAAGFAKLLLTASQSAASKHTTLCSRTGHAGAVGSLLLPP
jgi:hypothetical protein